MLRIISVAIDGQNHLIDGHIVLNGQKMDVEQAEVLRFDAKKKYGFAGQTSGPEIFFHLNQGGKIVSTESEPAFVDELPELPLPAKGDKIAFVREDTKGHGYTRAFVWVYSCELTSVIGQTEKVEKVTKMQPVPPKPALAVEVSSGQVSETPKNVGAKPAKNTKPLSKYERKKRLARGAEFIPN